MWDVGCGMWFVVVGVRDSKLVTELDALFVRASRSILSDRVGLPIPQSPAYG